MLTVQPSEEIRRVLQIPRRVWTPVQIEDLRARLTAALRAPTGTQTLLPLQAVALAEIGLCLGAFVGIPVGGGKTLTSALAPRMVGQVEGLRPLLLLPAHLIEKTYREFDGYRAQGWQIPSLIKIESYQTLGRVKAAEFLKNYAPTMIIADEADYLKNPQAAVTRRVFRYLEENPGVVFVPMTGTPTGKSIRDMSHLMSAALRQKSTNPCPESWAATEEWARALDCDVPDHLRLNPGPLLDFAGNVGLTPDPLADDTTIARRAFQRRMFESPGVVLSQDGPLAIPLVIKAHLLELDDEQTEAFAVLRKDAKTPDDEIAPDGNAIWRHARELANGFYQVWIPRPPTPWREARTAWNAACRDVISHNRRGLDSELAVRQHLANHPEDYPEAAEALEAWNEIEPTFVPNPVPVWISDQTIDRIVEWAEEHGPALIWTDRPAVGERLAGRGLPYYGEQGIDVRTGRTIEQHDPASGSAVVARRANDSGRNLQAWSRNLVIDVPAGGRAWEQMIGRTHRQGQRAPRVTVDVLVGCIEDLEAFWRAHGRSTYAQDMTGQSQKLLHANLDGVPDLESLAHLSGPQWRKGKPVQR